MSISPSHSQNGYVIALTNQRGRYVLVAHDQRRPERKRRIGVGKTTTAVNLGVSLAKQGSLTSILRPVYLRSASKSFNGGGSVLCSLFLNL